MPSSRQIHLGSGISDILPAASLAAVPVGQPVEPSVDAAASSQKRVRKSVFVISSEDEDEEHGGVSLLNHGNPGPVKAESSTPRDSVRAGKRRKADTPDVEPVAMTESTASDALAEVLEIATQVEEELMLPDFDDDEEYQYHSSDHESDHEEDNGESCSDVEGYDWEARLSPRDTAPSASRVSPRRFVVRDFDRLRLNEPEVELSYIEDEELTEHCLRNRLRHVISKRKEQAAKHFDQPLEDRIMKNYMASFLNRLCADKLLEVMVSSLRPSARKRLGRSDLCWELLRGIAPPSDSDLSDFGIYIDLVALEDEQHTYCGSGTAEAGVGSRLTNYLSFFRRKDNGQPIWKGENNRHMRIASQPGADVRFRLISTFPKSTKSCLVLLCEGLWIDFFQCIEANYATPDNTWHNLKMDAGHRECAPPGVFLDSIGMNHASPVNQPCATTTRQLKKQDYVCPACAQYKPNIKKASWELSRAPDNKGQYVCGGCHLSWVRLVKQGKLDPKSQQQINDWRLARRDSASKFDKWSNDQAYHKALLDSLPWLQAHDFKCPVCDIYRENTRYTENFSETGRKEWKRLPCLTSSKFDTGVSVFCRPCHDSRRDAWADQQLDFDSWVDVRRQHLQSRAKVLDKPKWLEDNDFVCVCCKTSYKNRPQLLRFFMEFFGRGFACRPCINGIDDDTVNDVDDYMQVRQAERGPLGTTKYKANWLESIKYICPVCNKKGSTESKKWQKDPDDNNAYICANCWAHRYKTKPTDIPAWKAYRRADTPSDRSASPSPPPSAPPHASTSASTS